MEVDKQVTRDSVFEHIVFSNDNPWEALALAIILSGFKTRDKKFFLSRWAEDLFSVLNIEGPPHLYYAAYCSTHKEVDTECRDE